MDGKSTKMKSTREIIGPIFWIKVPTIFVIETFHICYFTDIHFITIIPVILTIKVKLITFEFCYIMAANRSRQRGGWKNKSGQKFL